MRLFTTMWMGFCLLFAAFADSQTDTPYGNALKQFDELKAEIRKLETQLNTILNSEILQQLCEKQEEFNLHQFLSALQTHTGIKDDKRSEMNLSFQRINVLFNRQVLKQLKLVTEQEPNYMDASLKLAEACLLAHREGLAIEAFNNAQALQFQGVTFPLALESDFSPDRMGSPLSLRKLVYDIATLYIQEQIATGEQTRDDATVEGILGFFPSKGQLVEKYRTLSDAERAAVALVLKFVQFRQQRVDKESTLSEEERLDQTTLHFLEVVRFYLQMGQPYKAREWLNQISINIQDEFDEVPKTQAEIKTLKGRIEQPAGRVFLDFDVKFDARIRLFPAKGANASHLAISYQDNDIQIQLANQIRIHAGKKSGGIPLSPGEYMCYVDVFETRSLKKTLLSNENIDLTRTRLSKGCHKVTERESRFQLYKGNLALNAPARDYTLRLELHPQWIQSVIKLLVPSTFAGLFAMSF